MFARALNMWLIHTVFGIIIAQRKEVKEDGTWVITKASLVHVDQQGGIQTYRQGMLFNTSDDVELTPAAMLMRYEAPADMADEYYSNCSQVLLS